MNTWNTGQGAGQFTATIDRWSNIPAEGSLIQKTGDLTVYLVRHGRKVLLLNPGVLTVLLGRGWNEVQQVDDAKLAQIDDGTPLVPFWVKPPPGPPPALWIGRFAGAATVLVQGDWALQYWAGTYEQCLKPVDRPGRAG